MRAHDTTQKAGTNIKYCDTKAVEEEGAVVAVLWEGRVRWPCGLERALTPLPPKKGRQREGAGKHRRENQHRTLC